jgi:ABC-type long-subunit fatty acid transport system fused permease/ATPase subunit
MPKPGRPPNKEKIARAPRYTSVRLPLPVLSSLRWCVYKRRRTEKRYTVQKFIRVAVQEFIDEVDSGKIDTSFPKNNWYECVTDIYGVQVDKALLLRAKGSAGKLYHSVSGFFALAIMRAVSKMLDPENRGIVFEDKEVVPRAWPK